MKCSDGAGKMSGVVCQVRKNVIFLNEKKCCRGMLGMSLFLKHFQVHRRNVLSRFLQQARCPMAVGGMTLEMRGVLNTFLNCWDSYN